MSLFTVCITPKLAVDHQVVPPYRYHVSAHAPHTAVHRAMMFYQRGPGRTLFCRSFDIVVSDGTDPIQETANSSSEASDDCNNNMMTHTRPTEDELIERAMAAYFRYHAAWSLGGQPAQPSEALSSVEGDRVILRNVNGVLAIYQYIPKKDRIKRLQLN